MDYSKHVDRMINREIAIRKGLIPRDSDTFHHSAEMTVDYTSDMNAAVELLRECGGSLTWDKRLNEWEASAPVNHARYEEYYIATHSENPARAICEAYLAWRDGQG